MKMNILVLTSSYPRFPGDGTAPFVKSLAENMSRLGHSVYVLAPYDLKVQGQESDGVRVHRFRYIFPERYHIMGHAQAMEADVRLRSLSYLLLPFFMISELVQALRIATSSRAEIIHVHWVLPNGPVAALASILLGIPFVLSLHGSDVYIAKKNKLFGWVARWVFKRASAITACSPDLRDAAISLGAPDNIRLVAWGADPQIFDPQKYSRDFLTGFGLNERHFVVSTLGRMVYKKGFDRLIDAWKSVSTQAPDAHLLIGGDGPIREELIAKSSALGMAEQIIFAGNIRWDKVPEFLSSSDLFILPSIRDNYGNIDGLPTVLLEAMSCGKPVIASRLGGIPLVIRDGHNGILVPPGDIAALSQSILDLMKDSGQCITLGNNARNDVVNQYNWINVAKIFVNMFDMALWRKHNKTRMGSIYRDEMLRLLNLRPCGGRVLDVGCHDGLFLSDLNASLKIGIDPDPVPGVPEISLLQADGCNLPFSDGSFDRVYALDVIEHVADDVAFSRSLIDVLSLNGRLLITTPSEDISVFPPFTRDLVNSKWGHNLRPGYSAKKLIELFNHKNVDVNIKEWNAPSYRFLYFPVRALFAIFPGLTHGIIRALALWDYNHQRGTRGFFILVAYQTEELKPN